MRDIIKIFFICYTFPFTSFSLLLKTYYVKSRTKFAFKKKINQDMIMVTNDQSFGFLLDALKFEGNQNKGSRSWL